MGAPLYSKWGQTPLPSAGNHTIKVETYGGVSTSFSFVVLVLPSITSPTSDMKAYMWQKAYVDVDPNNRIEPFNITGTGLSTTLSTVYIDNKDDGADVPNLGVAPKANSCSYASTTSITGCDIDRTNPITNAVAETDYTLEIANHLTGNVSSPNSIRIEQISPTAYNFVGGTVFNTTACNNLIAYNFPNSSTSTYHTALVTDTRNNQKYRVRKLVDNRCWMVDNLKIANASITSANSNNSGNYTIPAFTTDTATDTVAQVGDPTAACNTARAGVNAQTMWMPHSQTACGYFYNFMAATAGWGTASQVGTSDKSICPAGWKLPNGSTLGSEFIGLGNTGSYWVAAGAFSGIYSGIYSGNAMGYQGMYARWWTLTTHPTTQNYAYGVQVYSAIVQLQFTMEKKFALPLRCFMG